MSDQAEFVIERKFAAPRRSVWRAWTDPDQLAHWYGPQVETIIHKFEVRPGGLWLNEMRWDGNSHFSKGVFQEVDPLERLVWHHSSCDSQWKIMANPMMADWPQTVLTIVTFEDDGPGTKLKLIWRPFEASEAEIACFAGAAEGFGKGWQAGFAIMDDLLAKTEADPT